MNDYAKIFIDRPDGPVSLVSVLQHAVGATQTAVVVDGQDVEVELQRNPDAGTIDGFLGYPMFAEVEGKLGTTHASFVTALTHLVRALDDAGYHYVTASDFEDQLPGAGRNADIDAAE